MKPPKTYLTAAEAQKRWGAKLKVKLAAGGSMYAHFDAEGGTWRPEFDPDMKLAGYRLVRRYETTRPHWWRRGTLRPSGTKN